MIDLLIPSIVAGIMTIFVLIINKYFDKNKDRSDYAKNLQDITDKAIARTEQALDDLQIERKEKAKQLAEYETKLQEALRAPAGPFLLKATIMTLPQPVIIDNSIELIIDHKNNGRSL